jgi:glycosyltransferase involved in cell wall biosynthesis
MARLLVTAGLSREARRTPGWLARLLRYIAQSPMAAGPVREYAVIPLIRLLTLGAEVFPGLAYRPCLRSDDAIAREPHPRTTLGHVAQSPRSGRPGHDTPGVNILGYFSRELGIGEAARSLANACDEAGIAVTRIDAGELFDAPASVIGGNGVPRQERHPIDILYYNADVTLAGAQHLRRIGHHSRYRIGFWHWEQPILPLRFHDAFAEVDELWVPSTFIQEAIGPVAPVPVVKIPHAVRFAPTPGVNRAAFGLPQDKCLVLVMYDFQSFQERKNPQAAIAAFRQAKATEPSLALVIKTINSQHYQRERQKLQEALHDVPDVTFIDAALTRQQAWDLEMCCDILLSLHRAEGFGLILAEMMYLGKSVVATGWSANMDFMDESNSLPVAFELKPLPRPIGPYEAGIPWAEPDIDHAAAALRRLVTDRDLAARLGQNARETIRRTLDPQVVGARVRQRLDIIERWFPRVGAARPP